MLERRSGEGKTHASRRSGAHFSWDGTVFGPRTKGASKQLSSGAVDGRARGLNEQSDRQVNSGGQPMQHHNTLMLRQRAGLRFCSRLGGCGRSVVSSVGIFDERASAFTGSHRQGAAACCVEARMVGLQ